MSNYRYYRYKNQYGDFYQLEVRCLRYFWWPINITFFSLDDVKEYVDNQRRPVLKYTYL